MKLLDASAPTSRAEALALSTRAQRWRAGAIDAHGHQMSEGARFTAASCASLGAMLAANGWTFERGEGWCDDARERFVSTACCWMHPDHGANGSTFVRAVRLTLDALAGRARLAGVAPIPAAKAGAS